MTKFWGKTNLGKEGGQNVSQVIELLYGSSLRTGYCTEHSANLAQSAKQGSLSPSF